MVELKQLRLYAMS